MIGKVEIPIVAAEEALEMLKGFYYAIDGLWFLGVEEKFGFENALDIDLKAWENFTGVLVKRIRKKFRIAGNDLKTILTIVGVYLSIENNWDFEAALLSEDKGLIKVNRCPAWDVFKRTGRDKVLPCKKLDTVFFDAISEKINSDARAFIGKSFPNGDNCCEIYFEMK